MAGKKAWLTWLAAGEDAPDPQKALGQLVRNGLQASGAPWIDDPDKMAWLELVEILLDQDKADLWLIAGRRGDFQSHSLRYGLSMVAASLRSRRDSAMPMLLIGLDFLPRAEQFPTLLRKAQCIAMTEPSWGAKVVAAGFMAKGQGETEFRFNTVAHPMLGQWFEVGPVDENITDGIMFGVSDRAEITHHAVGSRGELPERSVLEYPMIGIKAEVGGNEYSACAVRNRLTSGESYYIKVSGYPSHIMFGDHPDCESSEVTILQLS